MKKFVAAFATTGAIIIGATGLSVSAAEAAEYEVEKNDTLWGIANQYDMSVQQLVNLNGLDSTIIHPGQIIQTSDEGNEESKEEKYTVVKGDTLSEIALKYGVTVDELQDWNDLSSTLIFIGQELTIKGVEVSQEPLEEQQVTNNTSEEESTETVQAEPTEENTSSAPEQEG